MAIQPSDVQYGLSKVREERVEVGRLYDDGFLCLKGDPGVWIQSNPDSVSSVRSLELDLDSYEGERIRDSIGELSQLTHLSIRRGWDLKCVPNTLSRLHNLHHLELSHCNKLEELPANFGDLYNLTYLSLEPCHSLKLIESVAKLSNLTTLVISELKELPPNLGGLYNLKSLTLDDCENYVIESVTKLSNLTTLIIYGKKPEVLPANLGDLKFLASLFLYRCYRLRCLPWSITKLSNLRFLHLTEEFRIETLPPHLNDSIIISVAKTHIRKTWKELKTQITELPIITEELAAQKTSTPGYLQFKGDPTLWIRDYNNYGLLSSLRVLDLDYQGKIPDSIGELSQLTHLYISNGCLPHHLPPTFSRLTHLSLIRCIFECHTISHFGSLGNLSTLTSLHLCPDKLLPEHMDLPISLTHLTLDFCYSSFPDRHIASMAMLSNLNTLTLSYCVDLESLPLHLNLTKLILRDTTIKSLPIGLKHLEIIHRSHCKFKSCNQMKKCLENQLVNLETLSYKCYAIKSLSSVTSLHNLRELQLKDCFNLRELPPDLDKLVNLYTLDVSGTRIHSLPDSIINLHNLQHLILPKCFIPKRFPCDFENKVTISVDDTDESYYKHAGYYDSVYELSDDEDSINSNSKEDDTDDEDSIDSNSTEDVTEIVAGSRQEAIIEQASPHRPLNHPPDEIQILEDPTSNDNPYAFISSPNHEIKNLPTSNEAGTIPFVVDASANTMPGHAPMEIEEDKSNFPYHIKIPSAIMDYLFGYKDVEADGNCGFRCVAEVFHGGQENWPMARRAILNELKAHPDVYQKIYRDDYDSALRRIDWNDGQCGEDHYMAIVADLYPIANCYQCPVMCFFVTVDELNPQLSATVLPWNIGAHSARPTKELSIAHLGERYKHYILLDLKDDFPVPPIPRLWYDIIGKTTVDWVSRYEERRNRWDQLTNRSRDSTHLVIRDDCNVNGGKSLVGENISHGHAIFNKEIEIQTLNSSRKGVVVTSVNLELAIGTAFAPALCKSQNSVKGGSNNHALVIGQHKKSQTGNVKHNNQRIEISRESINTLRSEGLTLEKAAEHFNVSRSTLKRRLREYEIKWPSGKKSKILDTNRKKRQHKESGRNLSQTNSVDPSNPTRQGQMELAGPSQLALSTLATLGQGMEHPIGQKHPTLSDFETIDSKDADPQQLEDFISQFGYIIINKSTEFHTYGHQRVEEPLNGDKAGRNLSGSQLMNNLVDPSNPTSHGQGMEHLAEPSQPALSNNPASHGQGVEHPNRQKEPTLSVLSGSTIDSKDVDRQDYEKLKNQLEDLIKPTECHQRVEEQLNIDKDKAGRNLPGSQLMINLVNPSNPSHGQGMEHLAEPSQPALFNRAIHGQGVEHLGGPSQPALFNPASHGQGVEHIAGSSQPTLSYHVPSEHNVVNNSTPDVVTTTVGEPPLSTQYCMDSHQHVEEHNGANEPAMVNTDLLPNESSSTFVVKATFNEDTAKFNFSLSSSIEELKDVVRKKLELEVGTFKIKYKDIDNDLVLMNDTSNLDEAVSLSRKSGSNVVRLSIFLKT